MRKALVGTFVVAGIALSALPAAAHAFLTGSSPEDGATVDEPPSEIVLEFNEPIRRDFTQVAVLDSDDGHHEDGDTEVVGSRVIQAVGPLEPGEYRASYRVGSADGHPVPGVITFTVTGETGESDMPTPRPTDEESRPAAADPTETGAAEPSEEGGATSGDSDSAPLWIGVAAAVAVGAGALILIRRRPGNGDGSANADNGP